MPNKEQIEEFVANGETLLYDPEVREGVMEILSSASSPPEGIGNVALMLISNLEQSLGGNVSDEILLAGAVKLIQDIAEFGQDAGLFEVTDEIIQYAMAYAVQEYIKGGLQKGKYTEEELMQGVQQLEQEGDTGPSAGGQQPSIQDEGVGMPLQEQEPQRGLL